MKIAFVIGDDLTQNHRVRREAWALATAGHRVTVYGAHGPGTEAEEESGGVVYVRTQVAAWATKGAGLRNPVRLATWYRRFESIVRLAVARETPECIHAHDLDILGPAHDAARALQIPCVYEATGAAYVDRLAGLIPQDARGAGREAYVAGAALLRRKGGAIERGVRKKHGLAATIVDTDSLADDLQRRYGGERPIVVRDCPQYVRIRHSEALRVKIGAFPTDRILLFLGPAGEGSGLDTAVRALRLLPDDHLLVVLGRVPRQSAVEKIAEDEGVESRVRFIPPVPDDEIPRFVASADVALVPTEPSTAVNRLSIPPRFFAALAAGVPIVAADTREVGAIVRRTRCGVLYPARSPQDAAALAEGIHVLVSDKTLARTCADQALRAVRTEFNWARESLKLVDIYDAIEHLR